MIDLHELAQLPHGEARKRLIKEGLWDEWNGLPEEKFDVYIEYTVSTDEAYRIKARHKDEAIKKAEYHVPDGAEIHVLKINGETV